MNQYLLYLLADVDEVDSRFGHGRMHYVRDFNNNPLWVPFIMFVVIAVAWYILTIMNKRQE